MDKREKNVWTSHISELQNAYEAQFKQLDGDSNGRLAAQSYLNDSDARYHGEIIGMGFLPKLYDEAALNYFDEIATRTYSILEKVTQRFIEDESYRALFRFSPLMEQLILLPETYECAIPICRLDIFLNEDDGSFKFCEFNTDGTSAMNEDREVSNALALSATLTSFNTRHTIQSQELFDPWVETFMKIYESSSHPVLDPVVAIVDYYDSAIVEEQLEFQKRFTRYGITCLMVDVSTLEYKNGELYGRDVSKDHPAHVIPIRIDAVYRRAVTHELLLELEKTPSEAENLLFLQQVPKTTVQGARALVAAVVEQKICMIGGFKTQVAHSKSSYCLLHHPKTQEFLTEEECAFIQKHVPYTTWLKEDSINIQKVKNERENWIIKPVDGYSSQGVQAGKSLNEQEWELLIDEKLGEDYIVQEYCEQYQTLNTLPVPKDEEGAPLYSDITEASRYKNQEVFDTDDLQLYNILTGLYCYGGKFSGIYVRSGPDAIIVGSRGGITLASLLVDYQPSSALALRPRTIME